MSKHNEQLNQNSNIAFEFFKKADLYKSNPALKANGGRGKIYSYSETATLVKNIAAVLSKTENNEIGILSENRPEWCISYLAILASGKTVVPIDANLKEKEIDYIINNADIKSIFTSVRFESFLKQKEHLKIFSFNEASPNYWLSDSAVQPYIQPPSFNNTAVLIYTSGTTGDPKAVELTHKNILSNINGIKEALEFTSNDIFLSILPLHHTFEATCGFLLPLLSGCTVVSARSLKSNEILEDIKKNQATIMIGVPQLFEKMYHSIKRGIAKAPLGKRLLFHLLYAVSSAGWKTKAKLGKPLLKKIRHKAGLGSLRMFVSGAAALPPSICRFFNYIGFDFFQGYGMTETSPVLTAQRPDNIVFGSVGSPVGGVEIKIDNPDKNNIGEILARGENITPGYRNNPEETRKLLEDGWLHTGDLGKIKNGHLWITGRKKNIIVTPAGKNIYPEQIEEKILESDYVIESVVLGRKNKDNLTEEVIAIIVPDWEHLEQLHGIDPAKPDMEVVNSIFKDEISKINTQMADFKRIKSFEIKIDEFEKTSTKKIKRFMYN